MNLIGLNDIILIKIINHLSENTRQPLSLACELFHNLIINLKQNAVENEQKKLFTAIAFSRSNKITKFFQIQTPGLLVSYQHVFETIMKENINLYISGGAIRDLLSMREVKVLDVDFSFDCPVEKLVEIARINQWKFSKKPDFPVIQIGDRKSCCLQGISVEYTLQAPLEKLEFCLNNVFYHYNQNKLIDRTSNGLEDILKRTLRSPLEDKEL